MTTIKFDESKLTGRRVMDEPLRAPHCKTALAGRHKASKALPNNHQIRALRQYADQVGPVVKGCVTHAGGKAEIVCHADV